jgi:two-component system phosphate regulon sensor histidine kinase PhoR
MNPVSGFFQSIRSAVKVPFRWIFSRLLERHDRIHEKRIRREIEITLTHELKTPLTTILGYSEILLESAKFADEESLGYIRSIHRQSRELVRFIDNLIILSVIDFNPQVFFRNEADLAVIVREAMMDFDRDHRGESGYRFVVEGEDSLTVETSERLIRKSLLELFLNAWLYRSPDRELEIHVKLEKTGGYGIVTVSDNGLGISARYLPRIWEKFFRVEAEENAHVPGLGVGLCLVRQSVELFGGSITVESEEGKGTSFLIHLSSASGREEP